MNFDYHVIYNCVYETYLISILILTIGFYAVLLLRIYSSEFKMEVYLRITQLYLEEQDHVSAEAYLNRAGLLQGEVNNRQLQILYKV